MAGEWCISSLAEAPLEIIDGDRGVNYPKQEEFSGAGHCLFLNAGNVSANGFNFSDCAFITAQKDAALRKGKLVRNDVVLTTRGTVGNSAFFDRSVPFDHIRINSGMVILRPLPEYLHPRYLYLFVRSPLFHSQVAALRTGSAQPQLPIRDINRMEILVPPLPEQRAIAHILGTLDDKIELNRRMSETLEAMARALFKSWFVDFDPVRAKMEGRDPGLPKPLADLFPDSSEDSELGDIPKGWAVKQLSEMTTLITKGTTPTQLDTQTDDKAGGGINYVRVNAIDENGAVLFDKLITIPESVHLGVLKRSVLQAGDVLYTIAGTIGRIAIVDESLLPANTNQAIAIVRPKQTIPPAFLMMTMQAAAFREELHSNVVHAVQANLSLGVLSRARTVVPPEERLLRLFVPIADLTTRVSSTRAESRTLATLRDALLPKLISGELRTRRLSGRATMRTQ